MKREHGLVAGLLLTVIGVVAPALGADPAGDAPLYAAWRPLLTEAVLAGQGDDPADLYKLLQQGVMGPAHAASSPAAARTWLDDEWRAMADAADPPGVAWPLLDPVRPDSLLVRVHLRPLAALAGVTRGADAARDSLWSLLATAFVRTATGWRGDPARLRSLWNRALADSALWPAASDPVRRGVFTAGIAAAGWPAVHHGAEFARTRAPHYRVVARAELPAAWLAAAGWPARPGSGGSGAR